jgi:hypothetical protein
MKVHAVDHLDENSSALSRFHNRQNEELSSSNSSEVCEDSHLIKGQEKLTLNESIKFQKANRSMNENSVRAGVSGEKRSLLGADSGKKSETLVKPAVPLLIRQGTPTFEESSQMNNIEEFNYMASPQGESKRKPKPYIQGVHLNSASFNN